MGDSNGPDYANFGWIRGDGEECASYDGTQKSSGICCSGFCNTSGKPCDALGKDEVNLYVI